MVTFASQGVGAALNSGRVLHGVSHNNPPHDITLCHKVLYCKNHVLVHTVRAANWTAGSEGPALRTY